MVIFRAAIGDEAKAMRSVEEDTMDAQSLGTDLTSSIGNTYLPARTNLPPIFRRSMPPLGPRWPVSQDSRKVLLSFDALGGR